MLLGIKMTKRIFFTIVMSFILMGGMTICGCSKSTTAGDIQNQEASNPSEPDSTQKATAEDKPGITINQLNDKVFKLESSLTKNTTDIESTKSELNNSNRNHSLLIVTTLSISLFALLISIIVFRKVFKVIKHTNRISKEIDGVYSNMENLDLKIKSYPQQTRISPHSEISSYDYRRLSERITRIENQIRLRTSHQDYSSTVDNRLEVNKGSENNVRRGFFALPSQMSVTSAYFKEFYESRDSDSRFSVEIKEGKAYFKPLLDSNKLINGVKSGDVIKFALEFQGCPIAESKQMKVYSDGEATLKDNLWKITKKSIISLE